MKKVLLADPQDITRAGMMYVCEQLNVNNPVKVSDKYELIERLKENGDAIVVIDFTLFYFFYVEELMPFSDRFSRARWVFFSVDLSVDLVRRVALSPLMSVLLKESPLTEITECVSYALMGQRYICQRMTEQLLAPVQTPLEDCKLTRTEIEILKDIALGLTTREIAEKRFSSFHTVNTHRKNIFRKLGVNTLHEATKYALRAGLIDSAEYYI